MKSGFAAAPPAEVSRRNCRAQPGMMPAEREKEAEFRPAGILLEVTRRNEIPGAEN